MIIVHIIGLYCANPLHATTHYKNTASDIIYIPICKVTRCYVTIFYQKLTNKYFQVLFFCFVDFDTFYSLLQKFGVIKRYIKNN